MRIVTSAVMGRAERRAAPKPARIPRATKRPLRVHGERLPYSSGEGLS